MSLLKEYTSLWVEDFEKIKVILNQELINYAHKIEHIGSTAVPCLTAKSIIDIVIIYEGDANFEKINNGLLKLGYFHNGNQGIVGREVFKRNNQQTNGVLDSITHHLYVCKTDSGELQKFIRFRDYLRKSKITREFYAKLKNEIAIEANHDKSIYANIKQLKATSFINYVIELSENE